MKKLLVFIFVFSSVQLLAKPSRRALPTELYGYYELSVADDFDSCELEVELTDELAGNKFKNSLYFKGIRYKYTDYYFYKINNGSIFKSEETLVHKQSKSSYKDFRLTMEERRCDGLGAKIFQSCFGSDYSLTREVVFDAEALEFTAKKFDPENGELLFECSYQKRPF